MLALVVRMITDKQMSCQMFMAQKGEMIHMCWRIQVDYEEKSPLHFAAANGLGDALKILVDAKADVLAKVRNSLLASSLRVSQ